MLNMLRSQQEHSSQRSRAAKIKERDKDLKDRGEVKEDRGKETNLNTKKISRDFSALFSECLGLLGLVNRKEKLLS